MTYCTARDAVKRELSKATPLEFATRLGVNNTHVYKARGRYGKISPTLREALREHELIPPLPDYPYLKIRKDDPHAAAYQIIGNLGLSYASKLWEELEVGIAVVGELESATPG